MRHLDFAVLMGPTPDPLLAEIDAVAKAKPQNVLTLKKAQDAVSSNASESLLREEPPGQPNSGEPQS